MFEYMIEVQSIFAMSSKTDCYRTNNTNLTQQFKMASAILKQTIVKAILKVAEENPALNMDGQPSFEEARDDFIRCLMKELFPECPDVVLPTDADKEVTIPKIETDPVEQLTEQIKTLTVEEKKPVEKKKPAPRKPKAKAPGVNIKSLNKTQEKKLEKIAKDHKLETTKERLLEYLNGLTPEDFDAKKFEDHILDCFKPKPKEEEKVPTELVVVEFEGKEYYVDEKSKKVLVGKGQQNEDGTYPGWEMVGYVGMAAFEKMVIPEDDD